MPPCCPRCQSVYSIRYKGGDTRHDKRPLLLRCGHSFCEVCIKKVTQKNDTIICPTCQMSTKGNKSLEPSKYLHEDVYIVGLLTAKMMELEIQSHRISSSLTERGPGVRRKEGSVRGAETAKPGALCSECQVNAATCSCTKCDCIMCQECFTKVHQMSSSLKKHQAVPYPPESEDRTLPKKTRSRTCDIHDHCYIEYFCRDDNKAICSRCVIMGDHQGHNVMTMEDKNKEVFSEMEPAIHQAQEVVWRLGKAEKTINDALPAARVDTRAIADEIRDRFTQFHSLLQAREDQILDDVHEASLCAVNPLQDLISYVTEEKLNLQAAIVDAVRAMQGNIHRIIDADLVLERLNHAKEVACVLTPKSSTTDAAVKFTHERGNLQEAIASFGNIVSSNTSELFSLNLPSPDAEKPPPEVLHLPNVADTEDMSDTESIADSGSLVLEDDKEESVAAEAVDIKSAAYPPVKKLTVGHCEKVMVTHIRTPGQFYVQLRSRATEMESLSHNINSYCRGTSTKRDCPEWINTGDIVLAQYSCDKLWYRARVLDVVDTEKGAVSVEVFFMDYGNSEVTTLQKIRKIQKKFLKSPAFAHECALFDIVPCDEEAGWSTDAVQTMLQMTSNKPMILTVVNNLAGVLEVDLSRPESERMCTDDRPVSVRDSLVFLEMAVFNTGSQQTSFSPPRSKRDFVTLARMQPGSVMDVGINCVQSPFVLYCQYFESIHKPYGERGSDYLRKLLTDMQSLYSEETRDLYTIYCPRKGMICVAQYSKDGNWYRARVTGLPGGRKVEVQFVDYGNIEVVDHACVRKILDDYIKYPAQAVECSLADVEPADGSGEWSEEALVWFDDHVNLQLCQFRMVREGPKPNTMAGALYAINIDNNTLCCLNVELVINGFAKSTGPWSSVENFDGITLKCDQEVPELCAEDLAAAASALDPTVNYIPGLQPSPPSAASSLPTLHASASGTSTVSLSRKGEHAKKKPNSPYSSGSESNKPAGGHDVAATVASPSKTGPGACERQPAGPDARPSVSITFFRSPADFYIQLKEKEQDLARLMEQMKVYEDTASSKHAWKAGEYCAAKSAQDGHWYRGKVQSVEEGGICEVQMVDFGFEESLPVSMIRSLKKRHGDHECLAAHCHLVDLLPAGSTDRTKWSQTSIEFVVQQLKGKELYVKLEGEAQEDIGLPVDLLIEEIIPETPFDPPRHEYVSLTRMLLDKGLALPFRRRTNVEKSVSSTKTVTDPFHTKVVATSVAEEEEEEEEETAHREAKAPDAEVIIVQEDLTVPPHKAPGSYALTLVPVYVDYDGVIYSHDIGEEDGNSAFFERIDHYVRTEAPAGCLRVKEGQVCLAHFAVDNVWYRAQVLEVNGDRFKVLYIDFGNSAWVLNSQLKVITPELCQVPQIAYKLVLHNMKPVTEDGTWPVTFLEYIHSSVVNYKCTVEVKGDPNGVPLEVDMVLSDGRNLSATLIEMGVVLPKNDMEECYQRSADITQVLSSNPYFSLSLGQVGSLKHVLVTHIELPNLVYLQRSPPLPDPTMSQDELKDLAAEKESLNEFVQLMEDLNSLPPQTPALGEVPAMGETCSARFSEDNRWYRGLVAKPYPASKTALIFYVDYGNSEVVPLQRLRVLPARFQDTPAQALRAYLNVGLPEGRKRWTLDDFTLMAETIYLKRHAAVVKNTDPLTVELFAQGAMEGLSYQHLINAQIVAESKEYLAMNRQDVLIESDSSEEEEATVPV